MAFALPPSAAEAGYRLLSRDSIGSTSAEAVALGRGGEAGPLWVVAGRQTAGRGRRGSAWASPPGNLAASLLLTGAWEPQRAATLGFAAGLALHDALSVLCPGTAFTLKWPNDLLADGAKLAGILLETEAPARDQRITASRDHGITGSRGHRIVVVGIGVNVAAAPEGLPYPATSLAALGHAVMVEEVFEALAASWIACERLWDDGCGMAALRERWLAAAAGLGDDIAVRLGPATLHGTFETIDAAGQLVLRLPGGALHAVAAGEVHFGPAATAREMA
ncbi:MAG TPA: biotin--[acetyl-CoA-carboxylase] ligase [Beijerinckiaceae bacterium]|jgi:BirA family biotin operon repressor/biotin-[acetyl-CoA-carboxylase] ligase